MARGRRGKRRSSAREHRSQNDGRRRRPVPLVVTLAAVPVGLTLAGALLVTGAGEHLNPFRNTADGSQAPGEIGDAVADDSLVPEASVDDDFFAAPSASPQDRPTPSGAGDPRSADVTASSVPEDAEEDETSSGGGGGGGGSGDDGGGDRGGSGSSSGGGVTDQVVSLVNSERASAGCSPLKVDPQLTAAAQEHSEDMDRRDYMSHESPEGEGPADRADRHGYDAWGAENVAKGQTSAAQVMDAWMNSQGHRDNILNCGLVAIGVGESGDAWTQKFGWE
ncbi:CAP domain-containing protein [Nocardiopsis sp. CT-R113]|uniref:CAP domain-containing protein n=1 Tax=Nocardiopsis codii TaxID=3065942 RepID=A0ABU7K031_9ACTN|nr:CAP domain-containing protein [Nocardiopsis sp. CT-R113]MEE2035615.1 CAP domain-containing protein [Nocardiopsis sp. CT-R113]